MLLQSISKKINHLKNHTELRKILGNTGWLFADRILRMGIGLFVGVWVARYLGVEQYGIFNYSLVIVLLLLDIANLGLPNLIVKEVTDYPEKKNTILGTGFYLQLIGGLASFLVAVTLANTINHSSDLVPQLITLLALGNILQSFNTIDAWFQSQVLSRYTVLAKNTAFILINSWKIILINFNAGLMAFGWATLAEFILGTIGLVIAYQRLGYSLKSWKWDFSLARKLLKQSWPIILGGIATGIYMKIDQIMIGSMIGTKSVGIYTSAVKISEMWYFIPSAIVSSVAPSIYKVKKENDLNSYHNKIYSLLVALNILAVSIAIPMTFLSKQLIILSFGKEFIEASIILTVHIWSALFIFMSVAIFPWFIAEGKTNICFQYTICGAIINILLNYFLIPIYGGLGAAIATVISYAVSSFFCNLIYPKTRELFIIQLKSLIPILSK